MKKILICDDDPIFHLGIKQTLKGKFDCRSCFNGDEALIIAKNHHLDIILLDIQIRSPDEGLKFIPKLLDTSPNLSIVMNTGMTDFNLVREAMRLGAADYIVKGLPAEELIHSLNRIAERQDLLQYQEQQNFESVAAHKRHVLIGDSPAILNLKKLVDKVAPSPANVIITGETGTGKELIARQLRTTLPNGKLAPFIAIDSSTIQMSTAESLLFGHEKGAFTGAEKLTKGLFEEANNGIIYFDEIANMPMDIQNKLLRVLQEKEITRLGSAKVIELNFRVICATNYDLEKMVSEGKFKYDLLQRLSVIPIHVPPLRERKSDIPIMIQHFATKHGFRNQPIRFTPEALNAFHSYSWPGNVRELENVVSYVCTMAESEEIRVCDLPARFHSYTGPYSDGRTKTFYEKVAEFEEMTLRAEYIRFRGNISQLASALCMDRSHLYSKLKEYHIHTPQKNAGA